MCKVLRSFTLRGSGLVVSWSASSSSSEYCWILKLPLTCGLSWNWFFFLLLLGARLCCFECNRSPGTIPWQQQQLCHLSTYMVRWNPSSIPGVLQCPHFVFWVIEEKSCNPRFYRARSMGMCFMQCLWISLFVRAAEMQTLFSSCLPWIVNLQWAGFWFSHIFEDFVCTCVLCSEGARWVVVVGWTSFRSRACRNNRQVSKLQFPMKFLHVILLLQMCAIFFCF